MYIIFVKYAGLYGSTNWSALPRRRYEDEVLANIEASMVLSWSREFMGSTSEVQVRKVCK